MEQNKNRWSPSKYPLKEIRTHLGFYSALCLCLCLCLVSACGFGKAQVKQRDTSFKNGIIRFQWSFNKQSSATAAAMGLIIRDEGSGGQGLIFNPQGEVRLVGPAGSGSSGVISWRDIARLENDGSGNGSSKGRGGSALRIDLSDVRKARGIEFSPQSGAVDYITVSLLSSAGVWEEVDRVGPGKYDTGRFLESALETHTHLIVELNGAHELYDPLAGNIMVRLAEGEFPNSQASEFTVNTSAIKATGLNQAELLAFGKLLELRINGQLVHAGISPKAEGAGYAVLIPSPKPGRLSIISVEDFGAPERAKLRGRILGRDGEPLFSAILRVYEVIQDSEKPGLPFRLLDEIQTDEHGSFRIGLPEDREYVLESGGPHRIVDTRNPKYADQEIIIEGR